MGVAATNKGGAPFGNNNGGKGRPWMTAIKRALAQFEAGDIKAGQALRVLADNLVRDALGGDTWAIKEIADRVDGKPSQPIEGELHVHTYAGLQETAAWVAETLGAGEDVPPPESRPH